MSEHLYEDTSLIAASGKCYTAVVELLISRGAHVDDTDKVRQLWFGNCYLFEKIHAVIGAYHG